MYQFAVDRLRNFWRTGSTSKIKRISERPQLALETLESRSCMAADSILAWNSVLLAANAKDHSLTKPEQGGPVLTARAFAIVSTAMYDAYNSVKPIGDTFLGSVAKAKFANEDAAVARAAHDTLSALFPSQKATFDTKLRQTLSQIPNGWAERRGVAVGAIVARHTLAVRARDGVADLGTSTYTPNGLPGFHDVDPTHPTQGFYAPGAMDIKPFALDNINNFEARALDDGTPAGRAAFLQSQEYTDAYNEVKTLGGDGTTTPTTRTAEQTTIGRFWGYDGRPGLGTPPRLYNQIVRVIAEQQGNSEAQNARLFALVNVAMADAGVAAWNTKYDDAFWRPILGIQNGDADGNANTAGDADWKPLGAPASNPRPGDTNFTPPFPAYTSGHATFGAAAFQILTRFYHKDDIQFSFVSDEFNGKTVDASGLTRPRVVRSFDSFSQAKLENAESRIYLGIHWRFDADEGIRQGNKVANYVFDHVMARVTNPAPSSLESYVEKMMNSMLASHPELTPTSRAARVLVQQAVANNPQLQASTISPAAIDQILTEIVTSRGTESNS